MLNKLKKILNFRSSMIDIFQFKSTPINKLEKNKNQNLKQPVLKDNRLVRSFNSIGYFQFDNLIQNRVPFILYNMGPDLTPFYESVYRVHLEKHQKVISKENVIVDLKESNQSLTSAIILICDNGRASEELYFQLETLGYTNVYVVDGGYRQMMTEKVTT